MNSPLKGGGLTFGSLDASVADRLSPAGMVILDIVESVLRQNNADRDDPEDRRVALQLALKRRPDLNITPSDTDAIVNASLPSGETPPDAPKPEPLGFAAMEVRRLGSVERYHRLREIADEHVPRLDLDSPTQRAKAEALLFKDSRVETAITFDEAIAACAAREKLSLSESDQKRFAARMVRRLRPDLCTSYGSFTNLGA